MVDDDEKHAIHAAQHGAATGEGQRRYAADVTPGYYAIDIHVSDTWHDAAQPLMPPAPILCQATISRYGHHIDIDEPAKIYNDITHNIRYYGVVVEFLRAITPRLSMPAAADTLHATYYAA